MVDLKLWVVFGLQHRQVVFDIVYIVAFFPIPAGFILHLMVVNQVGFNSDYRFYTHFLCGVVKINSPAHIAVVGHSHGGHLQFSHTRHKFVHSAASV